MKIAVACGGTGGHIFPGLATACCLRDRGHDVSLWLAGGGVESLSLKGWDGQVVSVKAAGFPAGLSVRAIGVACRLGLAVLQCMRRMRRRRPEVLLAMGSYASVGPVLAARFYRIPVVLHEANAVAGRAVSVLARFASAVGVTFEAAAKEFGAKAVRTGLPLRSTLHPRFPSEVLDAGSFTVLIMGGSQGAHALNDIGSRAVCALHGEGAAIQVVHLTGGADEALIRGRYTEAGVPHLVSPFLDDMGLAYGAADMAVSRSGAASCMELAACGVPALLVPLPSARRDHQAANAGVLVAAGAADMVAQNTLSVGWLGDYLRACAENQAKREQMARRMKALAVPDAAGQLATLVENAV